MAKHAAPRRRSPWRPLALAVAGTVVLAGTGTGVLAVLSAIATGTQSASTGNLTLTLAANGTFGTAITNAAPGDVQHRFVTLTNGGTLTAAGLTLAASGTGSADLVGTASTALQVSVATCTVAWTPATGACSGTTTAPAALQNVPLGALGTARDVLPASTPVAAGAQHHVRVTLTVPDLNEVSTNGTPPATTVQGKNATVTFTFGELQRAATTTSS